MLSVCVEDVCACLVPVQCPSGCPAGSQSERSVKGDPTLHPHFFPGYTHTNTALGVLSRDYCRTAVWFTTVITHK